MAYSYDEWETVRAFYERGFSLSEIIAREEVSIGDRSSISRKAIKEGWIKGKKSTLVEKEIDTKQKTKEIIDEKSTFNATEAEIHNTIVAERIQDEVFFRKASLIITQKAIKKVQNEECSMGDLRAAQELVGKGKENIYGKAPDTAIQINNNSETEAPRPRSDFYE